MLKIRHCKFCGCEFTSKIQAQKYCCEECKEKSKYKGNICKICGKQVKGNAVTCSQECYRILQSQYCVFKQDDVKQKIKDTLINRYGVDNPSKCESISAKSVDTKRQLYGENLEQWRQKFEQTMNERYGEPNALQVQQCKDKLENTISQTGVSGRFHTKEWNQSMIQKYGTTIPYKNDSIKEKGIQTLLDKYGVTSPAKLDWVKEKSKNTCMQKYGVEYSFQSDNNKEKSRQTLLDKYGVENYFQLIRKSSKINKCIGELLNVDSYEFPLGRKQYDLKKGNTLIEINPTVSHNSDKDIVFGIIDKNYHFNKTKLAIDNGYRCFNIWDWDDIDKIKLLFTTDKINIGARKCEVAFIDKQTADNFLNTYHLQNTCSGDLFRVGLIYNDNLIGIMTFGASRYSNKYQFELLRLCYNPIFNVSGGSNKMLSFFKNQIHPQSIISYCDNSKFSGGVYRSLGFYLISNGQPTPHWFNMKTKKHITDNLLRQRGYDQLFGTNYGKGTSNEQLMLDNGFVRVYDCGQSSYGWINNET